MFNVSKPRSSSRLARVAGSLPEFPESAVRSSETSTPCLPLELKGLVTKCLQKADLKTLRFVSAEWHAMATPLLFERVYISPWVKDIQIFSNVTKHPVLRRFVKEMVCDMSTVSQLSHEDYFADLCVELEELAFGLSEGHPFNSTHHRLNELINARIRSEYRWDPLLLQYANDDFVVQGFRIWQKLAAEERQSLQGECRGTFFLELCSGLQRLSNLQCVTMEDHMWDQVGVAISDKFSFLYPHHIPGTILSGSPLARSWNPWHLRPKRSDYQGPKYVSYVMHALSTTDHKIKRFECLSSSRIGRSAIDFANYDLTDKFPHQMQISLCQLKNLCLQITPRSFIATKNEEGEGLGFLPQLLEQLTGLESLYLKLIAISNPRKERQSPWTLLNDSCYTYNQIFPRLGKWQHLQSLHLAGLAIDGIDLTILLLYQMPQLQDLSLYRVELLEGKWDGVIDALRFRALWSPWESIILQGLFRQEDGGWWPCMPNEEVKEMRALQAYADYAQKGGRHPSLPADSDDRRKWDYYDEMFLAAGLNRLQAFRRRVQEIEDRRT